MRASHGVRAAYRCHGPHRVAGLLVLLYAQWPAVISRLPVDQVETVEGRTLLWLGEEPVVVPEPLAGLLRQVAETRRGHTAIGDLGTSPLQRKCLKSAALRRYFPAALQAFDDLGDAEALELSAKAPTPSTAARLSITIRAVRDHWHTFRMGNSPDAAAHGPAARQPQPCLQESRPGRTP